MYKRQIGDPAPAELATASRPQLVSVVKHQTGSEALSLVAHRALDPDPYSRPSVHQVRVERTMVAGLADRTCRSAFMLCF